MTRLEKQSAHSIGSVFVWPEETFVEYNTWHHLKDKLWKYVEISQKMWLNVGSASNTAEHTEQICFWTRLNLPECFRHPTFGPVCSRLKTTPTQSVKACDSPPGKSENMSISPDNESH